MGGVGEDLRLGLRALNRNRGMAAAAVMSLALGIGANTSIFTLVNALLLRPIPVEEPSRLVAVHTVDSRTPGQLQFSLPNYRDYRDHNQVFSSLLSYCILNLTATSDGEPHLLVGQVVSANYFAALGVKPHLGRTFAPADEDRTGQEIVISYDLWANRYASDPQITSRTLRLNGTPFAIIGVAPKGFRGLNTLYAGDLWAPISAYRQLFPFPEQVLSRRALLFSVVGRLKPGVNLAQAQASLQPLSDELERQYPVDNQGRHVRLTSINDAALAVKTRNAAENAGMVLLVVSGLVLLIACSNVANLLLARAAGRSKEITVRLALGAGRLRLIRQLLTESLMLAFAGGALGLIVARWTGALVWALRPPMFLRVGVGPEFDLRVFGYTFLISCISGIFFGLLPAVRATDADLATDLKERTGRSSTNVRSRSRFLLVTAQIAFSVVALVGAGLFVQSVRKAASFDVGFDAEHLGIIAFNLREQGYDEARGREFERRILTTATSVPGVVAASLGKDPPFRYSGARTVLLEGEDASLGAGRITLTTAVSPGFFQTTGIALLRGRDFTDRDSSGAQRVAVVNQAAATHFWPGQEPVGRTFQFVGDPLPVQVVGVVRNTVYQSPGENPPAVLYVSTEQYYVPTATLHLRTAGNPAAVTATVKRAVQDLDRGLYLSSGTGTQELLDALWAQRLAAGLLSAFGVVALFLATLGIYGVVSYSVNQRVRDFGVRMALGATPGDLQRMVLREGAVMALTGVVFGTVAAYLGAQAVSKMLFGISPRDPGTYLFVPAVLLAVTIAACWVPAWRATRIDPAVALRDE